MEITFTVDGKPQPWRRARTSGKQFFKDAKTASYQQQWAWACRAAMGSISPLEGPVELDVISRFTVPTRASKETKRRMLAGEIRPIHKSNGDADNLAKTADSLNGIAFLDDAQIVDLRSRKVYAETAGVDVTIRPA